jgi:hypothetical protein
MDPVQSFNNQNIYPSTFSNSQLDTTFNISSSTSDVQHNTVVLSSSNLATRSQETVGLTEYSFFYNPPNDLYIYNIVCKETPISFELVSQLLENDINNSTQNYAHSNNLHEFHFLKPEEKKCYKITCELISHASIVRFLSKSIYDIEVRQNGLPQQHVTFSKELRENLEFHLRQFFDSLFI